MNAAVTAPARPSAKHSFVLEPPPADPQSAAAHFAGKLSFEADPSDVHADLDRGIRGIVVVDARRPAAYEECHIPGAVNLPHRTITAEKLREFGPDAVFVTYCSGSGCNASTRAALRISSLGFPAKEMIGGIKWWRREGYPVEGKLGDEAPFYV